MVKIELDLAALIKMNREEAIRYYMDKAGVSRNEAERLVSGIHPLVRDVVRPYVIRQGARDRLRSFFRLGRRAFRNSH